MFQLHQRDPNDSTHGKNWNVTYNSYVHISAEETAALYVRSSFLGAWILRHYRSTPFRSFIRGKDHRSSRSTSLSLSRFQQWWISNVRSVTFSIRQLAFRVYVDSDESFRSKLPWFFLIYRRTDYHSSDHRHYFHSATFSSLCKHHAVVFLVTSSSVFWFTCRPASPPTQ